jgi:hypothetical protein
MDTDLAPIDVANHWPFIRSNLHLERWPAAAVALDQLAYWQVDAGGQPVRFGTKFWTEHVGVTAGEAGRIRMVLLELERRRVVARYPGAGRRGNSWTFLTSIESWRSMPWGGTGRNVAVVVRGCLCRAARGGIARFPGHSGGLSRGNGVFCLSEADHIRRPGLLPVETRDAPAERAMPPRRPGLLPVETRDAPAANKALHLSITELELIRRDQRFSDCLEAFEARAGYPLWEGSKQWFPLARVFLRLTDAQKVALLEQLDAYPGQLHKGNVGDVAADLSTSAEVKKAGRLVPPTFDPIAPKESLRHRATVA